MVQKLGAGHYFGEAQGSREVAGLTFALRLYREYRRWEEVSPLAMEGLALELLAESSRRVSPTTDRAPPHWLHRVRGLLHDQFAEGLSLDVVAAEGASIRPTSLASSGVTVVARWGIMCAGCGSRTPAVDSRPRTPRWLRSPWTQALPTRATS
jgi:hypothetical protein